MSTKIPDAYKIKDAASVWPVLWSIRDRAEENFVKALREHYWQLVRDMDPDTEEYKTKRAADKTPNEAIFRLNVAHEHIRDMYKKNVTRAEWSTYTLDVSVALYPHKGEYYIRTFCERGSLARDVLDFVDEMPELEDFHYQNQSDRPDEVSEEAWNERDRIWHEILEYKDVGAHVALDIVCWAGYYRIDPWFELMREWFKDSPELPIREEVWAIRLRNLKCFETVTAVPGRIEASPGDVLVEKRGDGWVSVIKGVEKVCESLNQAADYTIYEHLPPMQKEWVDRLMARSKEQTKQ